MALLHELLDSLTFDAPLRSILVGVHWTVVCSRNCGLASSLVGNEPHSHEKVRDVGSLHHKSARELAEFALSDNLMEASIGVAAINSLIDVDIDQAVEVNAGQVLADRGTGKKIALVGHFPFIPKLRQVAGQLWVIEQRPAEGEHPVEAAADLIPQAEIVALTGSAIINHTLDNLLELCHPDALVMVLGPSTPLSPLLFDYGVRILSGALVIDETNALKTISQGATFQQVQGVKLLTYVNSKEKR
jgi:uncharacterized protein